MSVAWSPDYRRLACGAMDGTVVVFDVESRKLLSQLPGHHKPVRSLCFTPGALATAFIAHVVEIASVHDTLLATQCSTSSSKAKPLCMMLHRQHRQHRQHCCSEPGILVYFGVLYLALLANPA